MAIRRIKRSRIHAQAAERWSKPSADHKQYHDHTQVEIRLDTESGVLVVQTEQPVIVRQTVRVQEDKQ